VRKGRSLDRRGPKLCSHRRITRICRRTRVLRRYSDDPENSEVDRRRVLPTAPETCASVSGTECCFQTWERQSNSGAGPRLHEFSVHGIVGLAGRSCLCTPAPVASSSTR
jgi:hypothetical protein